jgi:hypothetical protein
LDKDTKATLFFTDEKEGNMSQVRPSFLIGMSFLSLTLPQAQSFASEEPMYCHPATFYRHEMKPSAETKTKRLHLFRLGRVTLAGLSVGGSRPSEVKDLAHEFSSASQSEGYCTWYLNKGNPLARREFNWHYVDHPGTNAEKSVRDFEQSLGPSFDQDSVSFVSCAENYGYIAMGCDGQMHRGPTGFAMLLAFTGCTPEHSVEIADRLWGLNGVPYETRLAVAKRGFEMGAERPVSRERLARLFD